MTNSFSWVANSWVVKLWMMGASVLAGATGTGAARTYCGGEEVTPSGFTGSTAVAWTAGGDARVEPWGFGGDSVGTWSQAFDGATGIALACDEDSEQSTSGKCVVAWHDQRRLEINMVEFDPETGEVSANKTIAITANGTIGTDGGLPRILTQPVVSFQGDLIRLYLECIKFQTQPGTGSVSVHEEICVVEKQGESVMATVISASSSGNQLSLPTRNGAYIEETESGAQYIILPQAVSDAYGQGPALNPDLKLLGKALDFNMVFLPPSLGVSQYAVAAYITEPSRLGVAVIQFHNATGGEDPWIDVTSLVVSSPLNESAVVKLVDAVVLSNDAVGFAATQQALGHANEPSYFVVDPAAKTVTNVPVLTGDETTGDDEIVKNGLMPRYQDGYPSGVYSRMCELSGPVASCFTEEINPPPTVAGDALASIEVPPSIFDASGELALSQMNFFDGNISVVPGTTVFYSIVGLGVGTSAHSTPCQYFTWDDVVAGRVSLSIDGEVANASLIFSNGDPFFINDTIPLLFRRGSANEPGNLPTPGDEESGPNWGLILGLGIPGSFALCVAGYLWYQQRQKDPSLRQRDVEMVAEELTIAVLPSDEETGQLPSTELQVVAVSPELQPVDGLLLNDDSNFSDDEEKQNSHNDGGVVTAAPNVGLFRSNVHGRGTESLTDTDSLANRLRSQRLKLGGQQQPVPRPQEHMIEQLSKGQAAESKTLAAEFIVNILTPADLAGEREVIQEGLHERQREDVQTAVEKALTAGLLDYNVITTCPQEIYLPNMNSMMAVLIPQLIECDAGHRLWSRSECYLGEMSAVLDHHLERENLGDELRAQITTLKQTIDSVRLPVRMNRQLYLRVFGDDSDGRSVLYVEPRDVFSPGAAFQEGNDPQWLLEGLNSGSAKGGKS